MTSAGEPSAKKYSLSRLSLNSAGAQAVTAAALAAAADSGLAVTVAVVDSSGALKAFARMDGAPVVSVEMATRKAYSAAVIGYPTAAFFAAIRDDPSAVATFPNLPGLVLVAGGVPLILDGEVAGAVGVAGAMTGAEDEAIAVTAAATLS